MKFFSIKTSKFRNTFVTKNVPYEWNSGAARNFWVMGRFPAKLFRASGNNGQFKINWATISLRLGFLENRGIRIEFRIFQLDVDGIFD